MNKSDIYLIIFIVLVGLSILLYINFNKEEADTALVFYEDNLILSIDLNINDTYVVEGLLGEVEIEVKDKKVRVVKENSPRNICSKEGYISDSSRPLICLPNKIVIKIVGNDKVDEVVY